VAEATAQLRQSLSAEIFPPETLLHRFRCEGSVSGLQSSFVTRPCSDCNRAGRATVAMSASVGKTPGSIDLRRAGADLFGHVRVIRLLSSARKLSLGRLVKHGCQAQVSPRAHQRIGSSDGGRRLPTLLVAGHGKSLADIPRACSDPAASRSSPLTIPFDARATITSISNAIFYRSCIT
jgi:hypothetical protein